MHVHGVRVHGAASGWLHAGTHWPDSCDSSTSSELMCANLPSTRIRSPDSRRTTPWLFLDSVTLLLPPAELAVLRDVALTGGTNTSLHPTALWALQASLMGVKVRFPASPLTPREAKPGRLGACACVRLIALLA